MRSYPYMLAIIIGPSKCICAVRIGGRRRTVDRIEWCDVRSWINVMHGHGHEHESQHTVTFKFAKQYYAMTINVCAQHLLPTVRHGEHLHCAFHTEGILMQSNSIQIPSNRNAWMECTWNVKYTRSHMAERSHTAQKCDTYIISWLKRWNRTEIKWNKRE